MQHDAPRFIQVPSSIYRLQLSADFTLKKARQILPYLKRLGIEGIYCSPYFKSFSSHGYDVTDPNALNEQLGTMEEYKLFCKELKELGLLHIMDIVPNHMGIKGGQNKWWQDLLENGPYSAYASFFDVDFSPEKKELQDRVLLPILGLSYGRALENQQIQLHYLDGQFFFRYSDYIFPAAPHSYAQILGNGIEELKKSYPENDPEWTAYKDLIELYHFFPTALQERTQKKEEGRERLVALFKKRKLRRHITEQVALFNGKKKRAATFDLIDKLLETQFYRLSYWRVARHEINYRRFFNVNELVAICIEKEKVFEEHHRWVFELIQSGLVQGLRIDHPDGLYDPMGYFKKLREKELVYTVAEKILGKKELLAKDWEVEGTVGYEYLNILNGIFIKQGNEKELSAVYEAFTGEVDEFEEIVYNAKKFIVSYEMVSEVQALGLKLDRLSESNRDYRDLTRNELTEALSEVIACFPVYRSYIAPQGDVSEEDRKIIKIAIEKAKKRATLLDASIFDFLEKVLLLKAHIQPHEQDLYREFVLTFQQLTAPIMAKGLEDTAFYIYNRLISLNEVGGNPTLFGKSVGDLHSFLQEKRKLWPYGFLASSTHDTKRSEDVRMRLNVLSEMPEWWAFELKKWHFICEKYRKGGGCANTEYYIYQTLLGVWPKTPFKKGEFSQFCERIWQAILKSIREAKVRTSWLNPDLVYEENIRSFFFGILADNQFLKNFAAFHKWIDRFGAWNSLSAVAIKMGCPGVVDIYQGNELLNYRLVDPDNRVNVNFGVLEKVYNSLETASLEKLFASHDLSRAKFLLQAKALIFRRENCELLLDGAYIPLSLSGERKEHVIAFMRQSESKVLIVIVGRFFSSLAPETKDLPIGRHVWGDTELLLPQNWQRRELSDLFTTRKLEVKKRRSGYYLPLSKVFESLPFSYLHG